MSGSETSPRWFADGLRFTCTRCGNCCSGAPGYVWVSAEEARHIAAVVGLTDEQFYRRHVRRVGRGHSLLELAGGDCEFLDHTGDGQTLCRIHGARPVQCRTWPFWKSNVESREAWRQAAAHCPGMDRGEHHPLAEVEAALHENGRRPL